MRSRRPTTSQPADLSNDASACREAALRLLERTRRTQSDLAMRLAEKSFAPETIAEVLERLVAVGLVDDTEYARAFLAGRWGRKPSGWRRLQQELRGRGVGDEAVTAARSIIEAREGAIDEVAIAGKLVAQARRRYARLDPRKQQQRLYALLVRRGYTGDVIRAALALHEDEHGETAEE
ncbi:MAG: regulatory protein RecX [Candidatus Eisenbacteria bacterium]